MTNRNLTITVECYAGYRDEESPRDFMMNEKTVEEREIFDRWLAPNHRYFKVRGDDEAVYILRHDTESEEWELTLFNSGKTGFTRLSST